jgi:hypothetical protein
MVNVEEKVYELDTTRLEAVVKLFSSTDVTIDSITKINVDLLNKLVNILVDEKISTLDGLQKGHLAKFINLSSRKFDVTKLDASIERLNVFVDLATDEKLRIEEGKFIDHTKLIEIIKFLNDPWIDATQMNKFNTSQLKALAVEMADRKFTIDDTKEMKEQLKKITLKGLDFDKLFKLQARQMNDLIEFASTFNTEEAKNLTTTQLAAIVRLVTRPEFKTDMIIELDMKKLNGILDLVVDGKFDVDTLRSIDHRQLLAVVTLVKKGFDITKASKLTYNQVDNLVKLFATKTFSDDDTKQLANNINLQQNIRDVVNSQIDYDQLIVITKLVSEGGVDATDLSRMNPSKFKSIFHLFVTKNFDLTVLEKLSYYELEMITKLVLRPTFNIDELDRCEKLAERERKLREELNTIQGYFRRNSIRDPRVFFDQDINLPDRVDKYKQVLETNELLTKSTQKAVDASFAVLKRASYAIQLCKQVGNSMFDTVITCFGDNKQFQDAKQVFNASLEEKKQMNPQVSKIVSFFGHVPGIWDHLYESLFEWQDNVFAISYKIVNGKEVDVLSSVNQLDATLQKKIDIINKKTITFQFDSEETNNKLSETTKKLNQLEFYLKNAKIVDPKTFFQPDLNVYEAVHKYKQLEETNKILTDHSKKAVDASRTMIIQTNTIIEYCSKTVNDMFNRVTNYLGNYAPVELKQEQKRFTELLATNPVVQHFPLSSNTYIQWTTTLFKYVPKIWDTVSDSLFKWQDSVIKIFEKIDFKETEFEYGFSQRIIPLNKSINDAIVTTNKGMADFLNKFSTDMNEYNNKMLVKIARANLVQPNQVQKNITLINTLLSDNINDFNAVDNVDRLLTVQKTKIVELKTANRQKDSDFKNLEAEKKVLMPAYNALIDIRNQLSGFRDPGADLGVSIDPSVLVIDVKQFLAGIKTEEKKYSDIILDLDLKDDYVQKIKNIQADQKLVDNLNGLYTGVQEDERKEEVRRGVSVLRIATDDHKKVISIQNVYNGSTDIVKKVADEHKKLEKLIEEIKKLDPKVHKSLVSLIHDSINPFILRSSDLVDSLSSVNSNTRIGAFMSFYMFMSTFAGATAMGIDAVLFPPAPGQLFVDEGVNLILRLQSTQGDEKLRELGTQLTAYREKLDRFGIINETDQERFTEYKTTIFQLMRPVAWFPITSTYDLLIKHPPFTRVSLHEMINAPVLCDQFVQACAESYTSNISKRPNTLSTNVRVSDTNQYFNEKIKYMQTSLNRVRYGIWNTVNKRHKNGI